MKNSNLALLHEMQDTGQDFEWYPTTQEIINALFVHANKQQIESLLDIGAGNGKVLLGFDALRKASFEENNHRDRYSTKLFAMEKSRPLLDSLPLDISIMGTDFWEQSLLDKKVDCIFSNPPYKDFIHWSAKLIREANANFVYLVLPQRWKNQELILSAIKARNAEAEVIGEFDFLEAEDRKARAKVDLIYIQLSSDRVSESRHWRTNASQKVDAFELWVKDSFGLEADKPKTTEADYQKAESAQRTRAERIQNSLVSGDGLIETLNQLYLDELNHLLENYKKVCSLDAALFKELDISVSSIVANIKSRIKGLKDAYWHELFDNYEPLTKRLTTKSRESFISTIRQNTSIDFTPSNAYAVTAWAIKNANSYFDYQMLAVFDEMVSHANVINYKSNQRVYERNEYRYCRYEADHVKLDFRIVLQNSGGLASSSSWNHDRVNGLERRAANFLDDLLVVAMNLGFDRIDSASQHHFGGSQKQYFMAKAKNAIGVSMELFTVRAFMNGNMHIQLAKPFALALNVEVGRLKGWIHNAQHGAEEMQEPVGEVAKYFKQTYTLLPNAMDKLLLGKG